MAEASLHVHTLDQDKYLENTHPMLSHINVGTGADVMIKELAETVKDVVGFKGGILFDPTKPDGTPRKLMDVNMLSNLGWNAGVSLKSGLERSYENFLSAVKVVNRS
jgi:GDP-L-fucose synthase